MTARAEEVLLCRDAVSLDAALAPHRAHGTTVAFVPTMGALHVGHRSLVEHAASLAPVVVVSIFVNPTQFDVAADLARYPRDLTADLALLGEVDAATIVVYAPEVSDLYPDGAVATVHVGEVTERLCGASRPGHFDGVATVVDALLRRVRPDVAVFGRKDHQQVVVVRRLVAERGHDVRIVAAPTVRDEDGIAISSRNQHLDADGRAQARAVPRALAAAVIHVRRARAEGREVEVAELLAAARAVLEGRAGAQDAAAVLGAGAGGVRDIDYLELVDAERIAPLPALVDAQGPALLAVAVHVDGRAGAVRLIDNVLLGDIGDEDRLLAAVGAR
jgi:pantoate--beta-alanine ligase